jgi:DNA-binding transcriptional LysR family regulator
MTRNHRYVMIDRLGSMAVFVKVSECGSFTAAAATLGMSSQMVGKHVRALETRLGAPLIRRTTRQQSLTDIGRLFYERCRSILAEAEAAHNIVQHMSATPRGRLRISAPVTFGAYSLAPLIMRYLNDFPAIEIELILTDRYVDIIEEGYDAVIRLGPLPDSSLASRELREHKQIACASPAYLATRGTPRTPEELLDHTCLGFINSSGRPYAEWRFTKNDSVHTIELRSRFHVNDGRVLLTAALDGHGIILQPEAVLREALDTGHLVPILTDYQAPSRPLHLLFSPQRPQSSKLRSFIDCVVFAFGNR